MTREGFHFTRFLDGLVILAVSGVTAALSGAELRIEPETLLRLPAGAKAHPSVQAASGSGEERGLSGLQKAGSCCPRRG